ncbi:MAG: hypothetical protein EAZ18_05585 [Oscillatoriales cyanobacterium]|nr:MAG: hypothetical protein EAZ18_05585 [Oscillatoriales cyanobacterium]
MAEDVTYAGDFTAFEVARRGDSETHYFWSSADGWGLIDALQLKKPGFSQFFCGVSIFSEKTRFLATHKTEETGFFAVFLWCIDILGKNPVSGHTQNR